MLKNSWSSISHRVDKAGRQGDKVDGTYMEKQSCEWSESSGSRCT